MEALKDIFVPYEIAQKLKEIGFDEECIASYNINDEFQFIIEVEEYLLDKKYAKGKVTGSNYAGFPVPTYEQVLKWFREKGYFCNIHIIEGLEKTFLFTINKEKRIYESDLCTAYETARELLIYKLIEIYKNGKQSI